MAATTVQMGTAASQFPPETTLTYVAENADAMPSYLGRVVDSSFGVPIVRVNNVAGQTIRYPSSAAWNADMTRLMLDRPPTPAGTPRYMLAWPSCTVLYTTPTYNAFTWSNLNPDEGWDWNGSTSIRRIAVSDVGMSVANTYALTALSGTYHSIHLGGGQGSISDDDAYLAFMFRKTNEDHGVGVFRTSDQTVITEYTVGNAANPGTLYSALVAHSDDGSVDDVIDNCGMSPSGAYVYMGMGISDGTAAYQGQWVMDRDGTNVRQITTNRTHWDVNRNAANEDVVGICSQSATGGSSGSRFGIYRLSDLAYTPTAFNWTNGHVSGRNTGRPGKFYLSTTSTTGSYAGFQNIFSVDVDDPSIVEMFATAHGPDNAGVYEEEPHAVASPDGTCVAFASTWNASSVYAFVAGMAL